MASTVVVAGGALAGCLDRPIGPADSRPTASWLDVVGQGSIDKIDLLLVIDNSGSMADKQDILASAVPQLVRRLVTPLCVDQKTGLPAEEPQNSDPDGGCPDGFRPEFTPIADINIGIISSSLGSVGSQTCKTETILTGDDNGHLLHRTDPKDPTSAAPTHEDRGFLAWDPKGKRPCLDNPDETCAGLDDPDELIDTLTTMVHGVGEYGCGYEAPLEAAYRFLVDPDPWQDIENGAEVVEVGTDDELLDQRKAFLRPDSLLAVLVLTDENDCSFRVDNAGGFAANGANAMPRARSECATDPDSKCCVSCWEKTPEGCEGDGGCAEPGSQQNPANYYPAQGPGVETDSSTKLRCWDQKRRFGIDFLYPVDRYVNAFSSLRIDLARNDLKATEGSGDKNPLFFDPETKIERGESKVYFAGIVGVPWQLVARKDADGVASLVDGLDPAKKPVGGFRTYDELGADKVWDLLLPENAADEPNSALMIESVDPRETTESDKKINGGEWDTAYEDLEYACIFDLPETAWKECTKLAEGVNCDCSDPVDKPLCAEGIGTNPTNDPDKPPNQTDTLQVKAKAYPGTRVLQVLRGLEDQGITASICPDAQTDVTAKNYGYTPAVFAIIDRLKTALQSSCQPRSLAVDGDFNAPCKVIEASDSDGDEDASTTGSCEARCAEAGRAPISDETRVAADVVRANLDSQEETQSAGFDCLCEIVQLEGKPSDDDWETSDRRLCQYEAFPPDGVDGWCYVDATTTPPIGNPSIPEIAQCDATEKRVVRPVGNAVVKSGGRQFISCAGDTAGER